MAMPEFYVNYDDVRKRLEAVGVDGKILAELSGREADFRGISDLAAATRYFEGHFRGQAAKEAHTATQPARDAAMLARDDTAHLAWM